MARARGDAWRIFAEDGGVGLDVVTPETAWALAVPGAVEQILDNLLANALEASPPATRITLSLVERPGGWELHVVDQGAGLSEAECERAFDRFYSRGKSGRGSGLGLAIVRQLAVAGGGDASLRAAPSGGLDVSHPADGGGSTGTCVDRTDLTCHVGREPRSVAVTRSLASPVHVLEVCDRA